MQKGSLWRILAGAHERVTLKCLKEKEEIKGNVALKQYIFVYLKKLLFYLQVKQ